MIQFENSINIATEISLRSLACQDYQGVNIKDSQKCQDFLLLIHKQSILILPRYMQNNILFIKNKKANFSQYIQCIFCWVDNCAYTRIYLYSCDNNMIIMLLSQIIFEKYNIRKYWQEYFLGNFQLGDFSINEQQLVISIFQNILCIKKVCCKKLYILPNYNISVKQYLSFFQFFKKIQQCVVPKYIRYTHKVCQIIYFFQLIVKINSYNTIEVWKYAEKVPKLYQTVIQDSCLMLKTYYVIDINMLIKKQPKLIKSNYLQD
eukprot:TRINITY_DN4524_c0_g1_i9.p1 TRINITY_DN4524_c0_g1~~TRINITY_DN4524_c0_g1_i9.p1  ORF type:complete len:262 (+),score=-28.64 TRINITY_DN4524_c0_g1_i9:280-1065(+)